MLATFLALILTLNNFVFNWKFYLHIKGCALGTICAHTYANIFIAYFEQTFIYPILAEKTSLYLRFIDDSILIWTKTEQKLVGFPKI